jgi:hypothetical protein
MNQVRYIALPVDYGSGVKYTLGSQFCHHRNLLIIQFTEQVRSREYFSLVH